MDDVLRDIVKAADAFEWTHTPSLVRKYAQLAQPVFAAGLKVAEAVTHDDYRSVWYNPESRTLHFAWAPQDLGPVQDFIKLSFAEHADGVVDKVTEELVSAPATLGQEPWMRVKLSLDVSTLVKPVGQATGWLPGGPIPPSPLAAMLGTGLLGAGLGYAGGAAAENIAPDLFEKNKLRKRTAILGGLVAALPGLWWATANMRHGQPITSSWPHQPFTERTASEKANKVSEEFRDHIVTKGHLNFPFLPEEKRAWENFPVPALFAPIVPVDQFQAAVWNDPNTPPAYQAMAAGLVDAASQAKGGVQLISPMDIARVAIGAGSGYLSGLLVGKALGGLAGITPKAQQILQRAGTWAGILTNTLPLVFGR